VNESEFDAPGAQDSVPVLVRLGSAADRGELTSMLRHAGLPIGRPVVVLVGGAGGLDRTQTSACDVLFTRALVPALDDADAVLVDGGTDSGIMRLAGRARQLLHARSPQVGVVAAGTVRWPSDPGEGIPGTIRTDFRVDLEPRHSHIVVVPGDRWGDEGPWLSAVAAALSGDRPSVTVLANGGDIAYDDVRRSLADGRRVLVLGSTGRAAAELTNAVAGLPADRRAVDLVRSPLLTVLGDDPSVVRSALADVLGGLGAVAVAPSQLQPPANRS